MPYFTHATEDASVVLFDGQMPAPHADHGLMDIALWSRPFSGGQSFEAVLRQLKKVNGNGIGQVFNPQGNPPKERQVPGRWVRFSRPPMLNDPIALLHSVNEELEGRKVLSVRPESY